jgi:hypothetical protein
MQALGYPASKTVLCDDDDVTQSIEQKTRDLYLKSSIITPNSAPSSGLFQHI